MGAKSRRASAAPVPAQAPDGEIPVVGGREPCPCGSGRRYKACHGRAARERAARLVPRPFEGLTGERDWIAMREIVPSATATVRTTGEHGAVDVTVCTVLPMAWPALRRADGGVLLGLQTAGGSGDPSRDVAHALLRALQAQPGTPVGEVGLPGDGPRLQDVLDPAVPFEVAVHDGFDHWIQDAGTVTPEVQESMDRANAAVIPTRRLTSVDAGYWCRVTDRCHLRWVVPFEERALLDGLARLQAGGGLAPLPGARFAGSFRAHGLLVPVWDLPLDTTVDDLEGPAKALGERLADAVADTSPLTPEQRRSRAGVVSRQVTLR